MRRLLLAALLLGLLQTSANAEERILSYISDIRVNADASLDVTEHIKVQAEGDRIKRGIYRDFPTRYKDKNGRLRKAGFEVTGIWRDGQQDGYHTEVIGGGTRIYVGHSNVMLQPGVYDYSISYHTSGWMRYFDNYDELYWNVTGNGWAFPIDYAAAIIHLPNGAQVLQSASYTGEEGATGTNATSGAGLGGDISFATTSGLNTHEGLTVAVGFQKGLIAEKVESNSYWHNNRGNIITLALLLVAATYYYRAWDRVGRDPKKGSIIPLFGPPNNMSPAECDYVSNMGGDQNRQLTAAIVNMAVKGHLTIKDAGKNKYQLVKKSSDIELSEEEVIIEKGLFGGGLLRSESNSITIGERDNSAVQGAQSSMRSTLKAVWKEKNFAYNGGYMFLGVLISLVSLVGVYIQISDSGGVSGFTSNGHEDPVNGPFIMISIWTLIAVGFVYGFLVTGKKAINGGGGTMWTLAGFLFIFVLGFGGSNVAMLFKVAQATGYETPILLLSVCALNMLMPGLLRAPTVEGRALMDKIEGFKMFLDVAEKHRLNALNPPEITPQLFEKYLPYAIAFDLEQEWGDKFKQSVDRSVYESYTPLWYTGGHFHGGAFASGFASGLASGLSNSVASSSSSGSGGGGSSGGGGGGGGGGGW